MGGGTLYKYVSMNEKQHLTVGISGGTECNPTDFIIDEHSKWSALWNPEEMQATQVEELMGELNKINDMAKSAKEFDGITLNYDDFKKVIKSYHKDSKGADNWAVTELKCIPDSFLFFNDFVKLSFKSVANPHQSLVSINALLGKPDGG